MFNQSKSGDCAIPAPLQAGVHDRSIIVNGCRVRFLCCGISEDLPQGNRSLEQPSPTCHRTVAGPPLLLIHGLLGYSYSWRHNLAVLARCAPVYAIDLPGVGFSERSAELDCSFGGLATTVLRTLDTLQLETIDLVGTSHGGAVAMMLAAVMPERVRRLVLVAPLHPWAPHRRWLIRMLATPAGRAIFRGVLPLVAPLNGYFLRRMYGDPQRIAPGTIEAYAAPVRIPGTHEHLLRIVRTWCADLQELERALPRIAGIPALLVWGDRDQAVPISSAERLRRQFRTAELAIIPGAGHLPYEEDPTEFNRIVCGFLHENAHLPG
jgi:pimeloyl-ACP methyl ester carboxylesterase